VNAPEEWWDAAGERVNKISQNNFYQQFHKATAKENHNKHIDLKYVYYVTYFQSNVIPIWEYDHNFVTN
jgi:hypothetical protein